MEKYKNKLKKKFKKTFNKKMIKLQILQNGVINNVKKRKYIRIKQNNISII